MHTGCQPSRLQRRSSAPISPRFAHINSHLELAVVHKKLDVLLKLLYRLLILLLELLEDLYTFLTPGILCVLNVLVVRG